LQRYTGGGPWRQAEQGEKGDEEKGDSLASLRTRIADGGSHTEEHPCAGHVLLAGRAICSRALSVASLLRALVVER